MIDVTKLAPYAKAVAAFIAGLASFAATVAAVMADGTVTAEELVIVLTALATWLGGTGAVYQVRNQSKV